MLSRMNDRAVNLRKGMIFSLLEKAGPQAKMLDLGCDDGTWSLALKEKTGAGEIYGVDVVDQRIEEAENKGVKAVKADLNHNFPFRDNFFDVVHADQVIEHITALDNFVSETYRVLKPGGYTIISTENGSSWHNIFAAIMGWQPFSSSNISSKRSVGNPLAIHRDKEIDLSSWTHKTIFNYRGLKEFFEVHGFKNAKIAGAGYHPFPASFGRIDPRHSHFITLKCYK